MYQQIQLEIDYEFNEFLNKTLRIDNDKLPYFYWTNSFFERVGGLAFKYFYLSDEDKNTINDFGKQYFNDNDVYFEVNRNSHRNDLLINKIGSIFEGADKVGQKGKYEYVKEYIFWKILVSIKDKGDDIAQNIIECQKKNFLTTYLKYLFENGIKPLDNILIQYCRYTETSKGENELKKINLIDEQSKLNDSQKKNEELEYRISKLYILKEIESKLYFIFSKEFANEKEELRELLDIMGLDNTGYMYRGQACSYWELDASIRRSYKLINNEIDMYYDILSLKPDAFVNDNSIYERLITMQHFGMPTRLMDVTRNPLVAIFFACNNLQEVQNDGVVFLFNPDKNNILNFEDNDLNEGLKSFYNKNKKETNGSNQLLESVHFIKGVAKNQRINNQSGDFIFVGNGENIKTELKSLPTEIIVIDAPTKKVLLEQLESLNIHGGSVYPDLSHMSNYVKNKYAETSKQQGVKALNDTDLKLYSGANKKPSRDRSKESRNTRENVNYNFFSHISEEPKEKPIRNLTSDFSPSEFWSVERLKTLNDFASKKKMDVNLLKQKIDDYLYSGMETILYQNLKEVFTEKQKFADFVKIKEHSINEILELIDILKK